MGWKERKKKTHATTKTEQNKRIKPQWPHKTFAKGEVSQVRQEFGCGRRPVIRSLATGCHYCLPKGSPQSTYVTVKIVAVGSSFAGNIPHS